MDFLVKRLQGVANAAPMLISSSWKYYLIIHTHFEEIVLAASTEYNHLQSSVSNP